MRIHNHLLRAAQREIHNSVKLSVKLFMRKNQAYAKKNCRHRPESEMCGKKEMPVIVVGNDYWIFDFFFFSLWESHSFFPYIDLLIMNKFKGKNLFRAMI